MNVIQALNEQRRDLEQQLDNVKQAIRVLNGVQQQLRPKLKPLQKGKGTHRISASARRRIARAQKKRWAAWRRKQEGK